MFKLKNNHSPIFLADLLKLPLRKGLRSSTYFHFYRIPSNNTHAKSALPTVNPFYGTLFSPILPLISLFSFCKAFKTLLFKHFIADHSSTVCNQGYINDLIRLA